MALRAAPAPFLTKAYLLVDDPATDNVISWNAAGTAFVVLKPGEFAQDLLPNYFKHSNFSSFIRQLNTYGFKKAVPDKWEFSNDNFKRGHRDLLTQIRRQRTKKANASASAVNEPSQANSGDDLLSCSTTSAAPNSLPLAQLTDLSRENGKLRKYNQMLETELAESRRRYDKMIAFVTQSLNVSPNEIDRILSGRGGDDDERGVKLFGVMVKRKRKRGGTENN